MRALSSIASIVPGHVLASVQEALPCDPSGVSEGWTLQQSLEWDTDVAAPEEGDLFVITCTVALFNSSERQREVEASLSVGDETVLSPEKSLLPSVEGVSSKDFLTFEGVLPVHDEGAFTFMTHVKSHGEGVSAGGSRSVLRVYLMRRADIAVEPPVKPLPILPPEE